MRKANYNDKEHIIQILAKSFDDNKSVNYIVKQGADRTKRIRVLMDYSFEVCFLFGEVFLSNDNNACALILYPDKKTTTLKSILLDIRLIFNCIGIFNILKAAKRESSIKKLQYQGPVYYLWFIGVDPSYQNTGVGTALLNEVIKEGHLRQRPITLETSTLKNLPWYKKAGFEIYNELDLGYRLYFLKKDLPKA